MVSDLAGVDNIGDVPHAYGIEDLIGAFAYLLQLASLYSVLLEESCCARSAYYIESEVIEAADQRQSLSLIISGERREYRAVVAELGPRCSESLVQSSVQLVVVSYRLSGGFHLR